MNIAEGRICPEWRRLIGAALLGFMGALPPIIWGEDANSGLDVPNLSLLEKERQLRTELEKKIQTDILDPILGRGKAVVFVSIELDVVTIRQKSSQSGVGAASKADAQSSLLNETEFILPGIPKPKSLSAGPSEGRAQQAKQERGEVEEKTTQRTEIKRFEAVIMHDETVLKETLDLVRQRIMDALRQFAVKPDQIIFKPTRMEGRIVDDLRQPTVYVPALFALLVFLFLMFLFGPLSSFMRGYVRLLERREGAEITMESEEKKEGDNGEGGGGGGGLGAAVEGDLETLDGEGQGGEEDMPKFEPFVYINEQNIKGLNYLLRREEPWVISVVLTYLKPEYGQKVLTALPIDLQARVAMETAVIREVTREQVTAIDQQIKERVDFVIGGLEPLVRMLEEAPSDIREGILEYLKNERPEVYDKIRKRLLCFEDLPTIPDKVLALAIRELKPSQIATAIRGSSPEIENKVFSNLSSGAVNLVKEEMELASEVTPEEAEQERQKILEVIKRMEAEGKVNFREQPKTSVIDGIEEDATRARERLELWKRSQKDEPQALQAAASSGPTASPESGPQAPQEIAYQWHAQGMELYAQGRYDEAVAAFDQALRHEPNFGEAHQGLGGCHYAMGKYQEALACYEQALAISPNPELEEFVASIRVQAQV
ncbi:MAG: tetratricopeptide repeat protein [Elusimicrobia bacterium]|nr:tetratricopeptide repeat protein [Elusimicrobiota bacterium]